MNGKPRLVLAAVLGALAFGTGDVACRAPTQIEIFLTTDVPCARVRGTHVTAGATAHAVEGAAPSVRSRSCAEGGTLGNLFLRPEGGGEGAVHVRVILGIEADAETCEPPHYTGCVVARRQLRYSSGETLREVIDLREACAGEACDETSTCSTKGSCIPAGDAACIARGDCPNAPSDGGDLRDGEAGRNDGPICGSPCAPCTENYCGAKLDSDVHNCGRCGHDCLGATCTAGVCDTVLVATVGRTAALAVHGNSLYVTNTNVGLYRVPKAANRGTPELLFGVTATISEPEGLAVDDARIYFAAREGVYSCPLAGCPVAGPTQIQAGYFFRDVATNGSLLVALEQATGVIGPLTGPLTPLAGSSNVFRCAVDGTHMYLTRSGGASRAPLEMPSSFDNIGAFDPDSPVAGFIALTSDSAYFTSSNAAGVGFVQRWKKLSQATMTYPSLGEYPSGIAVDACNVYWATHGVQNARSGRILSCPIDGCSSPKVLAAGLDGAGALVIDDDAIYVAEITGGTVRRLAKP